MLLLPGGSGRRCRARATHRREAAPSPGEKVGRRSRVGRGTAISYGRDAAMTVAEKSVYLFYMTASYIHCCAIPLQSASLPAIYYGMISTGDHGYFYPLREHSPRGSGRCSRTGATHRRAEAHSPLMEGVCAARKRGHPSRVASRFSCICAGLMLFRSGG